MFERTFFRILVNKLFLSNPFYKALVAIVNFCNEQRGYDTKKLKFLKKVPLYKEEDNSVYKKKFIFNSSNLTGANFK